MKRGKQRYAHHYNGKRNSRGKRKMSKIHKGLNSGNVEKAFKEVKQLKEADLSLFSEESMEDCLIQYGVTTPPEDWIDQAEYRMEDR